MPEADGYRIPVHVQATNNFQQFTADIEAMLSRIKSSGGAVSNPLTGMVENARQAAVGVGQALDQIGQHRKRINTELKSALEVGNIQGVDRAKAQLKELANLGRQLRESSLTARTTPTGEIIAPKAAYERALRDQQNARQRADAAETGASRSRATQRQSEATQAKAAADATARAEIEATKRVGKARQEQAAQTERAEKKAAQAAASGGGAKKPPTAPPAAAAGPAPRPGGGESRAAATQGVWDDFRNEPKGGVPSGAMYAAAETSIGKMQQASLETTARLQRMGANYQGILDTITNEKVARRELAVSMERAAGANNRLQDAVANEQVAMARTRIAQAERFDVGDRTGEGFRRAEALAEANVAERNNRLGQRNIEVGRTLQGPGVGLEAMNRHLEGVLRRQISIQESTLNLTLGSAAHIAEERVQRGRLNRAVEREVRIQEDMVGIAQSNAQKARAASQQRRLNIAAETPADRFNFAQEKLAAQARQRDIARNVRAGTDVGAIAAENADVARLGTAQKRADLAAVTPRDVEQRAILASEAQLAAAEQKLANLVVSRSATGQRAGLAEAQLATETAELKAVRARMAAGDTRLIAATAAEANARQEQAARVSLARAGASDQGLQGAELIARAAVVKRAEAERERANVARMTGEAEIRSAAQTRLEEAKLRAAIKAAEREMIKEGIAAGTVPKGNWFQNLQYRLSPNSDKLPQEYLQPKQFLGEKMQRTVGFAISGAVLGGGIAAVSQMVKDATALELTFVRLRGQMEGIGQSDAFPRVRDDIRAIAAETGQASDDVAEFLARMIGLSHDPAAALADTRSAMKLATVTGMDITTLLQSIVPIEKAFGVSTEEIGDKVVQMSEKFGIAGDDLVQYLGKTAAVAREAGANFDELAAFGANIANSLGKPIDSAAENTNKTFALLENNKDKIFQILEANPSTAGAVDPMIDAFARGNTFDAYKELLAASQNFTAQQKSAILTNVASRREAEEFNAAIINAPSILNDMAEAQENSGKASGKLESRFKDLQGTVAITFQTLQASFASLGEALFRSGISEMLVDIGNALKIVVGAVGGALGLFAKLNEILHIAGVPILGVLAKMAGTAFALTRIYGLLANTKDVVAKATERETRSETRSSAAKDKTTASTVREAEAEAGLGQARAASAGAAGAGPAGAATAGSAGAVGGFGYNVSGGRARAGSFTPDPRVGDTAAFSEMSEADLKAARRGALIDEAHRAKAARRARAVEEVRRRKAEQFINDVERAEPREAQTVPPDSGPIDQPAGPPAPLPLTRGRTPVWERRPQTGVPLGSRRAEGPTLPEEQLALARGAPRPLALESLTASSAATNAAAAAAEEAAAQLVRLAAAAAEAVAGLAEMRILTPLRHAEYGRLLSRGDPVLDGPLALGRGRDFNAIQSQIGSGAPLPLGPGSPLHADPRQRIPAAEYTTRTRVEPIRSEEFRAGQAFPRTLEPIRSSEFRAAQAAREQAARDALFGTGRPALGPGASRAFTLPTGPSPLTHSGAVVDAQIARAATEANLLAPGILALGAGSRVAPPAVINDFARARATQGRQFETLLGSTKEPIATKYRGALELTEEKVRVTGPGGRMPLLELPPAATRLPVVPGGEFGFRAARNLPPLDDVSRLARDAGAGKYGTPGNAAYAARYSKFRDQYAADAAAGTPLPRIKFANQALSGGKFLRAGKSDALIDATPGAQAGWTASPGWSAAIALAGAAAVKSAYDENKSAMDAEVTNLREAARKANADGMKTLREYQSGFLERAASAVFGTPLVEEVADTEDLFRQTSPFRRVLGGKHYTEPTEADLKIGEATTKSIAQRQTDLNRAKAGNLSDDQAKSAFDILNQSRFGRDIAQKAGLEVDQIGELPTGVDDKSGIWRWNALRGANAVFGLGGNKWGSVEGNKENLGNVLDLLKNSEDPEASRTLARLQPLIESGATIDMKALGEELASSSDLATSTSAVGVEAAINQLKNPQDQSIKSLNQLQSELDSGTIGLQEYLNGQQASLKNIDKQARNYKGLEADQYKQQLAKNKVDAENMLAKSASDFGNLYSTIAQTTSLNPKQAERDELQRVMAQMPGRIAVENLPQMLQADLAAGEETYSHIADPIARAAARKRGAPLSLGTRKAYTQKLFKENKEAATAAANLLSKAQALGAFGGMTPEQFADAIAVMSSKEGITAGQAARKLLDNEIANYTILAGQERDAGEYESARALQAQGDKLAALRPEVEASFKDLPELDTKASPEKAQAIDIEEAANKRSSAAKVLAAQYADNPIMAAKIAADEADAQLLDMIKKRNLVTAEGQSMATDEQVADARAAKIDADNNKRKANENLEKIRDQWAVIFAGDDPILALQAERGNLLKEQARLSAQGGLADQGAIIQNQQALFQNDENQHKAQLDIVRAGMSITAALVERSPLQSAQEALRRAEFEEQNAVGEAAKQQALADRIKAQHGLEDAINAGLDARASLATAVANANDDPVEAARIAASEAHRKLDTARGWGLSGDDLAPYLAATTTADRDLIRTSIQDQIDTIDFMQQMGQITTGQALESLKAVLATTKVGSKEYESLSLRIRSMTQSAQADLQFNLPTTLGLPTLYEARRQSQSAQQGIGYQDNRNVVVSIAVNGAQDPAAVALQVSSALQSSLRGGNSFTPYVSPVGG